jgi:hypothetical protein
VLRADLSYAVRMLRRNPGFSRLQSPHLALGIGANTAIFACAMPCSSNPLPYKERARIVTLWERMPGGSPGTVAPANFVVAQRDRVVQRYGGRELAEFHTWRTGRGGATAGRGRFVELFLRYWECRSRWGAILFREEDRPARTVSQF